MTSFSWWLLLLPVFCQTLPSNVGNHGQNWSGRKDDPVSPVEELSDRPVHQITLNSRQTGLQEVECGLKETRTLGPDMGNLETQGIFRDHDREFLDAVRKDSWEAGDLEHFGICTEDNQSTSLVTMKHLVKILEEPQGKHLVFLQMDKVEWDSGTNLQFQGTVQTHIFPLLQHTHLLALVFYPEKQMRSAGSHTSKVLVSVESEPQNQVFCMSASTRYLVLRVRGNVKNVTSSDLRVHLSVQIKRHLDGLAISRAEAQSLLFGKDKCVGKVAPVLLMILGKSDHGEASLPTSEASLENNGSSFQESMATLPAAEKDEFLETLSHFSSLVMNSRGKAKSSIYLPLDPSDDKVGDLRPQVFNVTEVEAMEWLVESQEPLVFFFLPGSKYLLETIFQEKFNGTLLEKVTTKIQEILEDMEEILSDGEQVQVLQSLLSFCHGSFNVSYFPRIEPSPQLGEIKHKKLYSLMLLKVLQAIRSYWQDRKKLSRQYRGAGVKSHCRLQELIISLKLHAEYKDIHFPVEININNCVGPCRFPQTTQSDYQAHVVLLIQLQEKKQTELDRPPCCVPVKYQGQWLMVADENGLRLQLYPNMVAKECGCR